MNAALLAAVHYLGAMVLFGCLLVEHMLIQPTLPRDLLRKLARIDLVYGAAAAVQITTGVARMFAEKGTAFYLVQPLFHAKLGVFVLLGLLSIYPTTRILAWRRAMATSAHDAIALPGYRRVLMLVRVEMMLLVLIPFLASSMARGIGAH